jgi:hypothetical protein
MKECDASVGVREAMSLLNQQPLNVNLPIIVGVTGPVASGKTRFCETLRSRLELDFGEQAIYLPFDYWVNRHSWNASTYAGRFLLDDFAAMLAAVTAQREWLCPRFDLMKRDPDIEEILTSSGGSTVRWQGRTFRRVGDSLEIPDTSFGSGVYIEPESQVLYSLVQPGGSSLYLIEGTLIFREAELRQQYALRIYVTSSWANRIARMIRRFNRQEVFAQTTSSRYDYVGFLADEATSCADQEIMAQLDDSFLMIHSEVATIGNLLDLFFLREELGRDPRARTVYRLEESEVDPAIEAAFQYFGSTTPEHVRRLRAELEHLVESRHLIALSGTSGIFERLRSLLGA